MNANLTPAEGGPIAEGYYEMFDIGLRKRPASLWAVNAFIATLGTHMIGDPNLPGL